MCDLFAVFAGFVLDGFLGSGIVFANFEKSSSPHTFVTFVEMEEVECALSVSKQSGSCKFKIEGWSGLGLKHGEKISSPVFNVCGNTWQLDIYPVHGYIGYYLTSTSSKHLKASVRFFAQTKNKSNYVALSSESDLAQHTFCESQRSFGRSDRLTKSILDASYLSEDTITFKVSVDVSTTQTTSSVTSNLNLNVVDTEDTLSKSMFALWEDGVKCDLKIKVGGENQRKETLEAHLVVLIARSPVFKAMFTHDMAENSTNEIVISDFPVGTIQEMLHFMYTDTLKTALTDVNKSFLLLKCAIKYEVTALVAVVENFLLTNKITDDNVVAVLRMADATGSSVVKEAALAHITKHIPKFAGFNELLETSLMNSSGSEELFAVHDEGDAEPATRKTRGTKRKK